MRRKLLWDVSGRWDDGVRRWTAAVRGGDWRTGLSCPAGGRFRAAGSGAMGNKDKNTGVVRRLNKSQYSVMPGCSAIRVFLSFIILDPSNPYRLMCLIGSFRL